MDELEEFLDQFDTQEVKSAQEMLRLPEDVNITGDKLLKYSISYDYDPNNIEESRNKAEQVIIKELKKRLCAMVSDKFHTKYLPLIGLNILHPFVYDNIGIQQPVSLVWTGYFYLEFNPAILKRVKLPILLEQLDLLLALKDNLNFSIIDKSVHKELIDVVPYLNRQIGKTYLLLNWAIKEAKNNPKTQYIYVSPTLIQLKHHINQVKKILGYVPNNLSFTDIQDNPRDAKYPNCKVILDEVQPQALIINCLTGKENSIMGYQPLYEFNLAKLRYSVNKNDKRINLLGDMPSNHDFDTNAWCI